jgi:Type II secretion system (T2SS), protein E, N-terminal domain
MKLSMESMFSGLDRGWKNLHWTCGLSDCQNKLFMRSVPQSCVGIRMGETWYCSMDCFVKATRHQLSVLAFVRSIDMPHTPRVSIGSVMLSKGYLTDEELRGAVAESRLNGEALENALVRLGLVDEWHLASARAIQWGYPVLGRDRISQSVDTDLPLSLIRTFSAAPLHYSKSAKRILMGFVYRVEHSLLQSIEQVTGCRTEPCFITPTELNYQMERLEAARESREVVLDDSMTAAEMANVVGGLALEITARDASLSRCRDQVWMRLSGKRRMIDVLFRGRSPGVARKCDTFMTSGEGMRAAG